MVRYALVELATMVVIHVANVASVPAAVPGFRNITEADWAAGHEPKLQDIWNGGIPAEFAAPAPAPDMPTDLEGLKAYLGQMKGNIDVAIASIDALTGGG